MCGGDNCYAEYKDEFPIRMDYLDNFDGGNLSIQCHPRKEYIRENFGEVLTQEETYYILDTCRDAVVYLGFRDDIDPARFEAALKESAEKGTPLDIPEYINSEKAHRHDLDGKPRPLNIRRAMENKCHVLNLVEGETAEIITGNGKTFRLHYAETLVIPAAAKSYRICNTSGHSIMVVKAFMK